MLLPAIYVSHCKKKRKKDGGVFTAEVVGGSEQTRRRRGRHGKDWEMFGWVEVSAAPSAMRAGLSFYVTEVRGPVSATPVGLLESLIL